MSAAVALQYVAAPKKPKDNEVSLAAAPNPISFANATTQTGNPAEHVSCERSTARPAYGTLSEDARARPVRRDGVADTFPEDHEQLLAHVGWK